MATKYGSNCLLLLKYFIAPKNAKASKHKYEIINGNPPFEEISKKILCAVLAVRSGPVRTVDNKPRDCRYQSPKESNPTPKNG